MVCDQSTSNLKALKLLGATVDVADEESTAHCIRVDGVMIPLMFDVPHLIKSVRNNFKKHGVKVGVIP